MMRWDDLFSDLEAQASAISAAEQDGEVAERTRIETSQLSLYDRLGSALDTQIRLSCKGVSAFGGTLSQLGAHWLLVDEGAGREAIVATAAILSVTGVGRLSSAPGSGGQLSQRLGLGSALRGVARDRSPVRLHLIDGSILNGTLDRVGADFVEIAEHPAGEPRRRDEVRHTCVVAMKALSVIRREG
jgi:hypothetical protein